MRYDGIYRIVKCWRKPGAQNFLMCRYLFVRADNSPAPWSSEGAPCCTHAAAAPSRIIYCTPAEFPAEIALLVEQLGWSEPQSAESHERTISMGHILWDLVDAALSRNALEST